MARRALLPLALAVTFVAGCGIAAPGAKTRAAANVNAMGATRG